MEYKHQRVEAIRAMRGKMWSPGRPSTARREDRVRFWEAIARGSSTDDAAAGAGVSSAVGARWFRESGGMPSLTLAPVLGRFLSFAEREEIAILRAQKFGVREIARQIGRAPSTISRELRRNASRDEPVPMRNQIATTYRTLLTRGCLHPVIATMVLSSVLLQALLEFGPLWMVALAAPAFLYGPHWAGLMAALGGGGALAGRVRLNYRPTAWFVTALMLLASLTLTSIDNAVVVIAAQAGLALSLVLIGIFLTRQLDDVIPSTIRAGVASGVGTLTWMAFLPSPSSSAPSRPDRHPQRRLDGRSHCRHGPLGHQADPTTQSLRWRAQRRRDPTSRPR